MRRRTRFERLIGVEDTLELTAYSWKRRQNMVRRPMMVHVQQRQLWGGLYPQSFEGITQLPSRLLNGG